MAQASLNNLIRDIANLLHSRGREVTPSEVSRWLRMMVQKFRRVTKQQVDEERIASALILGQNRELTMYLHLHFGDALPKAEGA